MASERQNHARYTFTDVEAAGDAVRPLDFPPPVVHRGVRVNALVMVDPSNDPCRRQVFRGVIHRAPTSSSGSSSSAGAGGGGNPELAYWPQRQLQDAIYGSVWACLVLRRSRVQLQPPPQDQEAGGHQQQQQGGAAGAGGAAARQQQRGQPILWEVTRSHVAIKMIEWATVRRLRGRHIEDPIKEVAAMQLLGNGNRHVLGSTEVLQDDHYLYSVMPYCRGGDLFGVVVGYSEPAEGEEEGQRMPEAMVRYWFRQICQGLYYLQSRGVCHRDLSLENILVDGNDCCIIDMGMCLRVPYNCPLNPGAITDVTTGTMRRLIRPQGVCGKHNYMSPEVFQNQEPFDGFAIDMWAAGVILYIMLTGFPPYDQASMVDQRFELIVTGSLTEQLDAWEVQVSHEAGDLMQRMLQFDPRRRLTLAQVMTHPWYTNPDVQSPNSS